MLKELIQLVFELRLCVVLQDGKDYIPLTAGGDTEASPLTPDPRSPYSKPQSGEILEAQLHYDNPPSLRSASLSPSTVSPLKVKVLRGESGSIACPLCADRHSRAKGAVGRSAWRRLRTSLWCTAALWWVWLCRWHTFTKQVSSPHICQNISSVFWHFHLIL